MKFFVRYASKAIVAERFYKAVSGIRVYSSRHTGLSFLKHPDVQWAEWVVLTELKEPLNPFKDVTTAFSANFIQYLLCK